MLIISRAKDEEVFILPPGSMPIRVLIVDLKGDQIKLGFDADQDIPILRSELLTEEGKRGL